MSEVSERDWQRALEAGAAARRAGRPASVIPIFGGGRRGQLLHEAWITGWRQEDERRR